MTAPPPGRPWRKRKRAWAAVALWLAVAYPASAGPAYYAVTREWLAVESWEAVYLPLIEALPRRGVGWFGSYVGWWWELAEHHNHP